MFEERPENLASFVDQIFHSAELLNLAEFELDLLFLRFFEDLTEHLQHVRTLLGPHGIHRVVR